MSRKCLALASILLASPSYAGKLDLDLYSNTRPAFTKSPRAVVPIGDLWRPGDPRYAQGESLAVQTLAAGGNSALGMAGFAQNIGSAGKSRESAAISAGFGAMALFNLWRTWKIWQTPDEEKKK